jgi:hypothetical protein
MTQKHRSYLSVREREAISSLHHMLNESGLLRATLVLTRRTCGRRYCRCLTSKKHRHLCWYVSQRHDGRSRLKFVPKKKKREVLSWIERYQKIKRRLDTISNVYWEALKKKS